MSDTIISPSIDLFLYDLKDGLGQDESKIDLNCEQFCKKIYGELDAASFQEKYEKIKKYKNSDAEIRELLETRKQDFPSPFDGYYYPLQFSDSYALLVDYSGKLDANGKPNDQKQNLDDQPFKHLKQEVVQRLNQQTGTVGQTWLAWGQLTSNKTDAEIEKIAQSCYTQLVSDYNWNRDFVGKGSLFGGIVFELWYRPENSGLTGKEFWDKFRQESHHILIWLFPDNQTPEQMKLSVQKSYQDFLRLFEYRHKIVWSYYQSRYQKTILKKEYSEIQPSINQIRQLSLQLKNNKLNISRFQETLTNNLISLGEYSTALNNLENQNSTLQVNIGNYKYRLAEIQKKDTSSNLDCLKVFSESEIYAQKYQRQIAADYAHFSPGLTLLQNLNSTIQGIIDLEQTKSDRTLNTTIALAGIGLATSQVASAVILVQEVPKSNPNDSLLAYQAKVFFGSLGIGVIATLISLILFRSLRR